MKLDTLQCISVIQDHKLDEFMCQA